jgi:putative copper export protein
MPGSRYARLVMIAVAVVVIVGMVVSMVAIPFTS